MTTFKRLLTVHATRGGYVSKLEIALRCLGSPARYAVFVFSTVIFLTGTASAQSFLERLEQAVKNQLEEPAKPAQNEVPSEELPAPKATAPGGTNTVGRSPPPQPTPPQNPTLVPSPTSRSPKGGRIYLGLEGEDPIGAGIGVRVSGLTKNSPAWKAGFVVGDRILAINGFAIARLNDMVEQLGKTRPGDTVRFLVSRAGRNIKLAAVLMAAELAEQTVAGVPDTEQDGTPFVGVTVNDLTSSFRKQFGISVFTGAAVSGVAKGSPAESAGIRAGDAIIEFNSAPIESARDLREQVSQLKPGQKVEVIYYRGGFGKQADFVVGNLLGTLPAGRDSVASSRPTVPKVQTQPQGYVSPPSSVIPAGPEDTPVPGPIRSNLPSILEPSELASPRRADKAAVPKPGPLSLAPSVAGSGKTAAPADSDMEKRVFELESENKRLANELRATQDELSKTRQKLDQILELLKQR